MELMAKALTKIAETMKNKEIKERLKD